MRYFFLLGFLFIGFLQGASSQCKIAFDKLDEFDSTRVIAAAPVTLGYIVPTENITEDLEGVTYTEEAKAIFSYADDEDKVRSFFLTLGVVERKFYLIDNGFTVMVKFVDGPIMQLYNVPADGEFNRDIMMWNYMHTCVVPLEIFHRMKNSRIEKIRINYNTYKSTIVLEEKQQIALQNAVKCVEDRLKNDPRNIKP